MTHIFSRIFCKAPKPKPIEKPDDSNLSLALKEASILNQTAYIDLQRSSQKQTRDAIFTREVIQGVLNRVEGKVPQ